MSDGEFTVSRAGFYRNVTIGEVDQEAPAREEGDPEPACPGDCTCGACVCSMCGSNAMTCDGQCTPAIDVPDDHASDGGRMFE